MLVMVLCLYLWKILVSAVASFVVILLAAARDVDFRWYATWNGFLGAAFGVDFLAATGAATAVLDFLFIVIFVRRQDGVLHEYLGYNDLFCDGVIVLVVGREWCYCCCCQF